MRRAIAFVIAVCVGVSEYKEKALVSFRQTVDALQPTIEDAQKYIAAHRDTGA